MTPWKTIAAIAVAACATTQAAEPITARRPPNIVLIISDDQGWTDYGFMGHPRARTPHLDRLAGESLVYTRGYVTTAVCCPSLSTVLTGLYPHQHGFTGNDPKVDKSQRDAWIQPFARLPQLPRLLAQAGYWSMHSGKYWQGDPKQISGFTHQIAATGRHGGSSLSIGRTTMQPVYDFIDQAAAAEKPFLLWYAPMMPHTPHTPPADILARYDDVPDRTQAAYLAMVEWFDATCGQLLGHLDTKGLTRDTLVMYLADNGVSYGLPGLHRSKLTLWDQGVRQPFLLRWPGMIPPRRDDATLASNIDIAPTILAAAGLAKPAEMPGLDLRDTAALATRDAVFLEDFAHDMIAPDQPARTLEGRGIVSGPWKLVVADAAKDTNSGTVLGKPTGDNNTYATRLYRILDDPAEARDLAADHPQVVADLRQRIDAWWKP